MVFTDKLYNSKKQQVEVVKDEDYYREQESRNRRFSYKMQRILLQLVNYTGCVVINSNKATNYLNN